MVSHIHHEVTVKVYWLANSYAVLLPRSSDPNYQPIIVTERLGIYGVETLILNQANLLIEDE